MRNHFYTTVLPRSIAQNVHVNCMEVLYACLWFQAQSFDTDVKGRDARNQKSANKASLTEAGQDIQWMKALVGTSTRKANQWRSQADSANHQTLIFEIFSFHANRQTSSHHDQWCYVCQILWVRSSGLTSHTTYRASIRSFLSSWARITKRKTSTIQVWLVGMVCLRPADDARISSKLSSGMQQHWLSENSAGYPG